MSLHCTGVNAEELRQHLLQEKGIGTVSIDEKNADRIPSTKGTLA